MTNPFKELLRLRKLGERLKIESTEAIHRAVDIRPSIGIDGRPLDLLEVALEELELTVTTMVDIIDGLRDER